MKVVNNKSAIRESGFREAVLYMSELGRGNLRFTIAAALFIRFQQFIFKQVLVFQLPILADLLRLRFAVFFLVADSSYIILPFCER